MSELITDTELAVLNAARSILRDVEKRAESVSEDVSYRLVGYGRLAEACDRAAGGLFNVLNVAHTYCDLNLTHEQLHVFGPQS